MLVPVADLVGNPGSTRSLHRTVAVEEVGDEPWGPAEGLLRGDITLELGMDSVVEGIWVHGEVGWSLELECGRCLQAVQLARESEVGELFLDPKRVHATDSDETDDVEDGYTILDDGTQIDLERMLHDVIVLDLPVAIRCDRTDCEPPALEGVVVLSEDEARAKHEGQPDPRWAALQGLNVSES